MKKLRYNQSHNLGVFFPQHHVFISEVNKSGIFSLPEAELLLWVIFQ